MSRELPDRLAETGRVIRVCRPDCHSHSDCAAPGKRPVYDSRATESLASVERWVAAGGNVGLALTGDLVAVDIDAREAVSVVGENLGGPTFTVQTGSGGLNPIFRCPDWDRRTPVTDEDGDELLSVRSDGWQVVIPPSTHPDTGEPYRVFVDTPFARVDPDDLSALLAHFEDDDSEAEPADPAGPPPVDATADAGKAAADLDELDRLIRHERRRAEVRGVLREPDAGHLRRVWVAGFLLEAAELSVAETVRIISKFNSWKNFDWDVTARQVRSVARSAERGSK